MKSRNGRWAAGGALVGALVAIGLGLALNLFLAFAAPPLGQTEVALGPLILRTVLIWGGAGVFFGAVLGVYASLMWKAR